MGDIQERRPVRGLTFEDVWAMFQETDRKFRETDRKFQETERVLKESGRETDRKIQETERILKESSRETDRKFQETKWMIEKLGEKTDKQLGYWGNRLGELAEYLVTPNVTEKFRELNYAFTKVGPNVKFTDARGETLTEVDAWLENGEFALAVEVKLSLRIRDVKEHIKRMEILRRYADERNDTRKLLGAVAGAIVRSQARDFALEQGFYVIAPSGNTVKIDIPQEFSPRVW
jgi:hypothetical protein